jgi:hypothetical protein
MNVICGQLKTASFCVNQRLKKSVKIREALRSPPRLVMRSPALRSATEPHLVGREEAQPPMLVCASKLRVQNGGGCQSVVQLLFLLCFFVADKTRVKIGNLSLPSLACLGEAQRRRVSLCGRFFTAIRTTHDETSRVIPTQLRNQYRVSRIEQKVLVSTHFSFKTLAL